MSAEANLVNLKSRSYLTHPNQNLFLMLRNLDKCIKTHANSIHVFENTYEEFLTTYTNLNIPCTSYETEILTDICSTCIIMEMR